MAIYLGYVLYEAKKWNKIIEIYEGGLYMGYGNRFEVVYKEDNALIKGLKMVLVDKETGVNYLFFQSGYAGGLTPLLDAEGKPVVTR